MNAKHLVLMLNLFRLRILVISKKHGAGSQYIQGQLDEAYHQIELQVKKSRWSNNHGF